MPVWAQWVLGGVFGAFFIAYCVYEWKFTSHICDAMKHDRDIF